ncbi:MAG: hypothetical protein QHI48_05740 [Bacteroidota bacterium]|nr:hypothetical protein [Bacteroidota bacterium]
MTKKTIWAVIAVFIAWAILDFILHNLLLSSLYEQTKQLWRPLAEMNMPLMYVVTLVLSICFCVIYGFLVEPKSIGRGTLYGIVTGLGMGFSMGFGSYVSMPIPLSLAFAWFIGSWVEFIIGGILVGLIIRPAKQ